MNEESDEFVISDSIRWRAALSIILCVLGIIGNMMTISTILWMKHYKKSVLFIYVLQLAIADMIFLLTIPFKVDESLSFRWNFPNWMCIVCDTILFINYNASILLLMVMGVDRYIAVCHAFSTKLQKLRRPTVAFIVSCVVWIISFLFSIPVMQNTRTTGDKPWCKCSMNFLDEDMNIPPNGDYCIDYSQYFTGTSDDEEISTSTEPIDDVTITDVTYITSADELVDDVIIPADDIIIPVDEQVYDVTVPADEPVDDVIIPAGCSYHGSNVAKWSQFIYSNFILLYILPILVLSVTYGLIINRLRKKNSANSPTKVVEIRSEDHHGVTSEVEVKSKKKLSKIEIKVIKMSISLVFTFVICWFPFHLFHLMKLQGISLYRDQVNVCSIMQDVGNLLAYTYPVINPLLYNIFATDILQRFAKAKSFIYKGVNKRINLRTSIKRVPPPWNEI